MCVHITLSFSLSTLHLYPEDLLGVNLSIVHEMKCRADRCLLSEDLRRLRANLTRAKSKVLQVMQKHQLSPSDPLVASSSMSQSTSTSTMYSSTSPISFTLTKTQSTSHASNIASTESVPPQHSYVERGMVSELADDPREEAVERLAEVQGD
jgi:hypothetical protein